MKPLVSVIIPVYNQFDYLLQAIDSVLLQEVPVQIIIIDDGSTDAFSPEDFQCFSQVVYYRQKHQGAAAARNYGVSIADSDWIAFLDADDVWLPNKLNQQLKVAAQKDIAVVFSRIKQFISDEFMDEKLSSMKVKREIMPGFCASTLLIKRSVFYHIGLFNETYQVGEFIDWVLKLKSLNIPYDMIDKILAKRRLHRKNNSYLNKDARKDYLKILHGASN